jgi:protein-tyrosine phosphatase
VLRIRPEGADPGDPFAVVFVCTANRARSPLAEVLFRHYTSGVETVVSSAGILDLGSLPALPESIEAARRLGVDLTAHRARTLHEVDLASADLVAGFELAHISAAVVDGNADARRTFLLGELITLVDAPRTTSDPSVGARAVVEIADSRRIRTRPALAHEIADPFGRPARTMTRTALEIDRCVRELVLGLFGPNDAEGWNIE